MSKMLSQPSRVGFAHKKHSVKSSVFSARQKSRWLSVAWNDLQLIMKDGIDRFKHLHLRNRNRPVKKLPLSVLDRPA